MLSPGAGEMVGAVRKAEARRSDRQNARHHEEEM